MTKYLSYICVVGLLLGCALCRAGERPFPPARQAGGVLRYALHTSDLGSLDPHMARGSQDATYTDLVFNGLLRYRSGDVRHIEPDLARELPGFEIRGKRQIWTVHLKRGVYFHPGPGMAGHELTAEDVVFSLKKAGSPGSSSVANLFWDMTFGIKDDYTLTITLSPPVSPLFFYPRLMKGWGGAILSHRAAAKGRYGKFLAHPVGTGPFRFKRYIPGKRLELEANPAYFRGAPKLDGVEVFFMPDNRAREKAFLRGRVDVIYGVGEPGWLERMERLPGSCVDVFGPGYTGLIHFNTSMKPLDDIRVRQAIMAVLDRNALMDGSSPRLVSPVYTPVSPAFLSGGLTVSTLERLGLIPGGGREPARELLREAGVPWGVTLKVPVSEKRLYKSVYGELKRQLLPVGIHLELEPVSHARYHELIRQNKSPLVLYFSFRMDPDSYLRKFFHSSGIGKTGNNTNFSHFTGVDELLDHALTAIDPQQQNRLWQQAQIKILSHAVVFPLFDINQCVLRRNDVHYGHPLTASLAEYPQFDETTWIDR